MLCLVAAEISPRQTAAAVGCQSASGGMFVCIYEYLFSVSTVILARNLVFSRLFALIMRSTSHECGTHVAILDRTVNNSLYMFRLSAVIDSFKIFSCRLSSFIGFVSVAKSLN